ncbi:Thermophilic serine proteinase precursor, putative [Perkinsus marinus ATCC 50983]|uniref:subtilisin n=3 Tax=Perkinsus marinus (strain ATCC 50983 / TXsc) TaxID=423536 RepID=C5LP87_PERM5|nr:Thermophilic serine proteinase precursor, putative [Perkinsus marinus ATCC 50983]EER01457.1 Thermophilic serine proteinase precursor, putative [Perkinsus marinus ATCC 50983]|eukprot:XP_002768739.1 Thermophilic serine proteinase precursor, putative [Perkinsus marinus ATCC 50983]
MFQRSAFLSTLLAYVITCGEGASDRTLLKISYRGAPLDIRLVPTMISQAAAVSGEGASFLSQDDRECERCFALDGMIYDLKAVGVQIVESTCSVGYEQILNYLRKARAMLGIQFYCEPDSVVTINPINGPIEASETCTGGNPVLGTNDPGSSCQRNLEVINIGQAWRYAREAKRELKDIVLAISDTGVDMTHPDLVGQFWKNPKDGSIGYNFITNSIDVTDDNGHGTHCAGNAAAHTNNSIGIAGVANINGSAPKVKLMILKFLNAGGGGSASGAVRALNFAVENGAAVSSHSYGGGSSDIVRIAFENAAAAGHITVAAAGNEGVSLEAFPTYPCCLAKNIPSMICVAASTSNPSESITLADFSNAGSVTKVAAPGVNIYSTIPVDTYGYKSGTSMSTPTVAGVAALLATLGLVGEDITNAIVASRKIGVPNQFNLPDIGELDALNATHIALDSIRRMASEATEAP